MDKTKIKINKKKKEPKINVIEIASTLMEDNKVNGYLSNQNPSTATRESNLEIHEDKRPLKIKNKIRH